MTSSRAQGAFEGTISKQASPARAAQCRNRVAILLTLLVVGAVLSSSCGRRYIVAEPHHVSSEQSPESAVATTERVLKEQRYDVLEHDAAQRRFKVLAKVSGRRDDQKSFIAIVLDDEGEATIQAEGHLVQEGKVHRNLDREVRKLAKLLTRGFQKPAPAAGEALESDETAQPSASINAEQGGATLPSSWVEVSSAPQTWGTGEFTCLPLDLPETAASELALRLSNHQTVSLTITLARGAGLCEKQCPLQAGCVALGLGDDAQVEAAAKLIASGAVAPSATLLRAGEAVARVELERHGSFKEPLARAKAELAGSK